MLDPQSTGASARFWAVTSLLVLAGVLTACGGGSGNNSATAGDADSSREQTPPIQEEERIEPGGMDDVAQMPETPASTPTPTPAPPPVTATAQATYQFVFTGQWTTQTGFGSVPATAHFSGIIGAAVNDQSRLWARGETASAALEEVAEEGIVTRITAQIRAEVAANAAREITYVDGPRHSGSVSGTVTFSDAYPAFTFVTMVAPSPDWFVGLSRQSMKDASGQWITSFDQPLPVYDAGTEEGDTFSTNGTPSNPRGIISRLNALVENSIPFADGLVNGNAIARIQLNRIR